MSISRRRHPTLEESGSVHNHEALPGSTSSRNQPRMPPEKTNQENKFVNKTQQIPTDRALEGEKSSLTLAGCWPEPKISQLIVVTVKPNDCNGLF